MHSDQQSRIFKRPPLHSPIHRRLQMLRWNLPSQRVLYPRHMIVESPQRGRPLHRRLGIQVGYTSEVDENGLLSHGRGDDFAGILLRPDLALVDLDRFLALYKQVISRLAEYLRILGFELGFSDL
jgi:hypothetical protein